MLFFELAIALIFLGLSVGTCYIAWTLPAGLAPTFWVSAGAFPFILGAILILLCVWWSLDLVVRIRREKRETPGKEKKFWLDELLGDNVQKLHFVAISVAILIYVFVLVPLCGDLSREYGFALASFIFLTVTIKFFNDISFIKTIIISAVSVGVIFVVFHYGLKVLMPT